MSGNYNKFNQKIIKIDNGALKHTANMEGDCSVQKRLHFQLDNCQQACASLMQFIHNS